MLSRGSWLQELPPHVEAAIRARLVPLDHVAGSTIRRAGDRHRYVYLVESGFLRLLGLHPDGRQALLLLYGPLNVFGESTVVAKRPFNHTTVALTDVRLQALDQNDFWELYREHPAIADALCRKFADAVSRQFAAREFRASNRLGQQIAATFQILAEHCGVTEGDGSCTVALPLSQGDFAEHLDVTRQAVQREIGALKQAGVLAQSGGGWHILDTRRLGSASGHPQG